MHKNTIYDLIANIVHDGKPTEGAYRIHVLHHVSFWLPLRIALPAFTPGVSLLFLGDDL